MTAEAKRDSASPTSHGGAAEKENPPREPSLLSLLSDLTRLANSPLDADGLLHKGLSIAVRGLRADRGMVQAAIAGGVDVLASVGWPRAALASMARAGADSHAAYTLLVGRTVACADLSAEARFTPHPAVLESDVAAALCAPMPLEGADGVLLLHSTRPREFDEQAVCFAQSVAGLLSCALARSGAQRSLLREREALRQLADAIDDVFFAMDHELRYTAWNRAAERFTGIRKAEALGASFYDLYPQGAGSAAEKLYLETMATGRPQCLETELDGEHHRISAIPFDGGVYIFARDTTEQVNLRRLAGQRVA